MKKILLKLSILFFSSCSILILSLIQVHASNRISFTLVILPAPKPVISETNTLIRTQEGLDSFINNLTASTIKVNDNVDENNIANNSCKDDTIYEAGKLILIQATSTHLTQIPSQQTQAPSSIYNHSPEQGRTLQLKC